MCEQHSDHAHTHTQTRAVVNRLARAIGHLERVKAMVEEGRDCAEVLVQLSAVRSALNNTQGHPQGPPGALHCGRHEHPGPGCH